MSLTDKTFEDFLREKLERPVSMKSAPGIMVLPLEAMAMSVMNNAMKGDIPSIAFVNNLIKKRDDDTPEQRAEQKKKFKEKCDLIRSELQKDGLWDGRVTELELLASEALILDRIADVMNQREHLDIEEVTLKDGTRKFMLSATDRIFIELAEQFRRDLQAFRGRAAARKIGTNKR